jgi:hypothetical protein
MQAMPRSVQSRARDLIASLHARRFIKSRSCAARLAAALAYPQKPAPNQHLRAGLFAL